LGQPLLERKDLAIERGGAALEPGERRRLPERCLLLPRELELAHELPAREIAQARAETLRDLQPAALEREGRCELRALAPQCGELVRRTPLLCIEQAARGRVAVGERGAPFRDAREARR